MEILFEDSTVRKFLLTEEEKKTFEERKRSNQSEFYFESSVINNKEKIQNWLMIKNINMIQIFKKVYKESDSEIKRKAMAKIMSNK